MIQAAIDFAKAQGEDGMQRAAMHAERVTPGWLDLAFTFVSHWCRARPKGELFTAEAFTDDFAADPGFIQPPDGRAWGAVVKRAIKAKLIEHVDTKGRRRKGHGSYAPRYRSLVAGKRATDLPMREAA